MKPSATSELRSRLSTLGLALLVVALAPLAGCGRAEEEDTAETQQQQRRVAHPVEGRWRIVAVTSGDSAGSNVTRQLQAGDSRALVTFRLGAAGVLQATGSARCATPGLDDARGGPAKGSTNWAAGLWSAGQLALAIASYFPGCKAGEWRSGQSVTLWPTRSPFFVNLGVAGEGGDSKAADKECASLQNRLWRGTHGGSSQMCIGFMKGARVPTLVILTKRADSNFLSRTLLRRAP